MKCRSRAIYLLFSVHTSLFTSVMTIFLGGGFAAKYLHGGGNFSVPLQWMLGLRRLKLDAFWLEHLPSEGSAQRRAQNRQLPTTTARPRTRRPVLCALS